MYCDRCGRDLAGDLAGETDHAACRAARALEPPRFCPQCARRMKVHVLPAEWRAECVEHGVLRGGRNGS
ncbi:MAG: hypothetical protein J2P15_08180 [Micromonosporaceae bacterium]|nr:hypothetical protein [Micromonosporaceae bacterium]